MVTINIGRKELVVLVGVLVLLLGVGFGVAYNSGATPEVMGHSVDEIEGLSEGNFELGDKTNKDSDGNALAKGAVYKATSAGFLILNVNYNNAYIYADMTNPPTTLVMKSAENDGPQGGPSSVGYLVSKDEYVKLEYYAPRFSSAWWKPIGSGELVKQ